MPETMKTQAKAFDRILSEVCGPRQALERLEVTTSGEFLCDGQAACLESNLMAPVFDDDDNEIPDTLVLTP